MVEAGLGNGNGNAEYGVDSRLWKRHGFAP